jgi:hypothetical protein
VQAGELHRIPTVGFDSVSSAPWNQCRGDDIAGNTEVREEPVELKAAGASLVAATQLTPALQLGEELKNRRRRVWNLSNDWLACRTRQLRDSNAMLMNIESNMDNTLQGRLLRMRLWPRLCSTSKANPRVCAGSRPFHSV